MQQSDPHCADIKRHHVLSGGRGRIQQSDQHCADIKPDHVLSAGGART